MNERVRDVSRSEPARRSRVTDRRGGGNFILDQRRAKQTQVPESGDDNSPSRRRDSCGAARARLSASRARSTPRVIVNARDAGRRSVRAIPRTNPRRRRGALRLTPRRPRSTRRNQLPSGGKHGRKTHLGLSLGDGLLGGLGLANGGIHAGGAHGTDGLDGGDHGGADEGGHGEHLRVLRLRVSEWEGGRGRNRRWVWV